MNAVRSARALAALALLVVIARPAGAAWAPPIGIPSPSFGINQVARATPNPWTVSTPGFYYVDATKAAATDTNNPYGTPAKPRRTIPWTLPAGAVVELHGTYDTAHSSPATIVAQGTAANPIFIRGVNATSRPILRRSWEVEGNYIILENLEFGPMPDQSSTGSLVIRLPASHVVLRHSDVHGLPSGGGIGIVQWEVPYGVPYTGPGVLDNIVIYNNTIHDNGDVNATFDQDVHGIAVSDHVRYLWVVDNEIYRNSGDGIQINAGEQGPTTHHIYVGRNVSHHNKQGGFWVKKATDVILSQNESYGHRPSDSSSGQCMGAQYAPDWLWVLYNHLHDCEYGFLQASDNQEPSHTFVIGNIIENIHRSRASEPGNAWSPAGIMMSGGDQRRVINNTIFNVDSGVNIASPHGSLEVADNIIATITQPQASHVLLNFQGLAANTAFHHNLLFGTPRLNYGNGQFYPTTSQLAQAASLNSDPQFLNPAAGDFHTAATSPATNRAEFNSAHALFLQRYGISIAFDADGNVRPPSPTTDMGAYLSAGSLNQAPTVSSILSLATNEDTATAALAFTVGDVETAATGLTVSGASSNTALVPNGNISFGGSGAGRTVSVTPAANMFGTSLITVTVNDGSRTASTIFLLTVNAVNDVPTISAIANQTTTMNLAKGPIAFTVGDLETAAGSLVVSATSSNTALAPNANVTFGGSGINRTVTILPAANRTGMATITVSVSDGGLTTTSSFNLIVPGKGDFDADGKADVILHNRATGQSIAWLMNGQTVGISGFLPTIADTNWEIKVVGDFNGDGRADVLLRNQATGQNIAWLMNGLTVSTSAFLATIDTNWQIEGAGDFNGDGKADVIWRHKVTGQNIAWLMNGLTVASSSFLSTIAQTSWEIKGVGDFNADGKADVIWRNQATGQNIAWLMNGLTVANSAFLSTIADTNWEIKGVGDFDRDGKADVLWRNAATGQNIGWLMNGLTVASSAFLSTIADTNWEVTSVGDAGGDSRADVVWRHKVTGENIAWTMNGLAVSNAGFLPTIADTNWEISGP